MGTAIGTKGAPPYACVFMDKAEIGFLKSQNHKPMVWFCYIHDIFFIWTHGEKELEQFFKELNKTHPNSKFTQESSEEKISILDLSASLSNGKLYRDLRVKAADCHQYLEYTSSHPDHTKKQSGVTFK